MLNRVRLKNFRCFAAHRLSLAPLTLVVGRNNAGKSTLVDALRIIATVVQRLDRLGFVAPPAWADLPLVERGVQPDTALLGVDFENTFHRFGEPPAVLTAEFQGGLRVEVHLGPEGQVHAVTRDAAGQLVTSRKRLPPLPAMHILPQLSPLLRNESLLQHAYVTQHVSTIRSSRHFRNQIYRDKQRFAKFAELVEMTWPGLRVSFPELVHGATTRILEMLVREKDFAIEAGGMGDGLQMWLQVMWFLSGCEPNAIVILDEPDVYLHPDLQRRLLRYARHRFLQFVVATHSVDMMSDAGPEHILVIERAKSKSQFLTSEGYQRAIDDLGGVHNVQLARLGNCRKCVMVEGNDPDLLICIHRLLFPESTEPLDTVPIVRSGGWGGWERARGLAELLKSEAATTIKLYCIFDRDYHTEAELNDRRDQASASGIFLHVWKRKEIENYLVVPRCIARVIQSRVRKRLTEDLVATTSAVAIAVNRICDELREHTCDSVADAVRLRDRGLAVSAANREARQIVTAAWAQPEGKLVVVPGKQLLSRLSDWSKQEYNVSFGAVTIARNLSSDEVHGELADVLSAIEHRAPLGRQVEG